MQENYTNCSVASHSAELPTCPSVSARWERGPQSSSETVRECSPASPQAGRGTLCSYPWPTCRRCSETPARLASSCLPSLSRPLPTGDPAQEWGQPGDPGLLTRGPRAGSSLHRLTRDRLCAQSCLGGQLACARSWQGRGPGSDSYVVA